MAHRGADAPEVQAKSGGPASRHPGGDSAPTTASRGVPGGYPDDQQHLGQEAGVRATRRGAVQGDLRLRSATKGPEDHLPSRLAQRVEGTARSVPKAGRGAAASPLRKLGRGPAAPRAICLGYRNAERHQIVEDRRRRQHTRLMLKPAESTADPIAERAASPGGHSGRDKPQFSRRGAHWGSKKSWPRPSPGKTNNKGPPNNTPREPRARGEQQSLLGVERSVRWP